VSLITEYTIIIIIIIGAQNIACEQK